MKSMIAYKPCTSTTGKLLRTILSMPRKRSQRRASVDVFLRWGTSDSFPVRAKIELNTREAVARATNKLVMMRALQAGAIPMPQFATTVEELTALTTQPTDMVYIRSKQGVVRYANDFNPSSDLYASLPIKNKRREYRVHVFNGKIIAIYEKVPHDQENKPALFKSFNCNFRLVNPDISRCDSTGQQIAINAVASLGLLFGGVDLIRDKDGNFFVCEVNSAPGLNETNANRWATAIKEYVNENLPSSDDR